MNLRSQAHGDLKPITDAPLPISPLPHQPHLPLNLIPEIEISPIERMHPHIPVLPTTRVPPPQRIHRDRIQRAEMPLDAADLVLEDLVVEAGFELALPAGGGGDVHGGLAAAEDDEGLLGGDGGGVEGGVRGVGFQRGEIAGGEELGGWEGWVSIWVERRGWRGREQGGSDEPWRSCLWRRL